MTAEPTSLDDVLVGDLEHWEDGPPHELFKQLRIAVPGSLDVADQPVPRGGGLLVGDHARRPARGQPRLGDVLVRARRDHRLDQRGDAAGADPGDVHRHGPAQARPAQAALPARLHAAADRRARGADPRDHRRGARRTRGARDLRPGHRRRPAGGLAGDRQLHGDPAGRRRDLGAADEQRARRRGSRHEQRRDEPDHGAGRARDLRALPAADRRAPRAIRPTT